MKAASAIILLPVLLLSFNSAPSDQSRGEALSTDEAALVDLGRYLFFDPRLSGDGSISCASCHDPAHAWADGEALSSSYSGSDGFRNAKSLLNAYRTKEYYWDGRLIGSDAETLVRDAITETHFMNMDGRLMLERLKQVPEYVLMFDDALGAEPSFGGTLRAIAAFQRTLVTGDTPFDTGTLSAAAERGWALFAGKAQCATCHTGYDFSDDLAHKTGVPVNPDLFSEPLRHATYRAFIKAMGVPRYMQVRRDVGRYTVTKNRDDMGSFITPGLRQVADTAPYMHNGIYATLVDVVSFYNERGDGLRLTDAEMMDLVAFLKELSGSLPQIDIPSIPRYQVIDNWREVRN